LSGYRWSGAITYSFPDSRSDYEPTYSEADNGFAAVSFSQMQAARYILEGMSSASGGPRMGMTSFEQFTSASINDAGRDGADIRIARSASANPTAYGYYPVGDYRAGDVWFGTQTDYTNPSVGNYAYTIMLHELGHALGLKHGHEAGGPANVALSPDRDSMEFSVMTYRSYVGASANGFTNETYGYAQTYMMYDIAALQHMYGPNFSTNSSNTTYQWDPNTGQAYINGVGQGVPGANRVFLTTWDGGGVDTYDFSNYSTNLQVNLSPGSWSLISQAQQANLGNGNYARGNVFNALQYQRDPRSLIENASGGAGNDQISGNAANNVLLGNGGDDTIFSGLGDDVADGGSGNDILFGGQGNDSLYGGDNNDQLYGGQGDDVLSGGPGDDQIYVAIGRDTVVGGAGNDLLAGGLDDDLLYGGDGADTIWSGAGNDIAYGGAGNDLIYGSAGNDRFYGEAGADTFIFEQGWGVDEIMDFSFAGGDRLMLNGQSYTIRDTAEGMALDLSGGGSIVLHGIEPSAFSAAFLV
jgi:serralysin